MERNNTNLEEERPQNKFLNMKSLIYKTRVSVEAIKDKIRLLKPKMVVNNQTIIANRKSIGEYANLTLPIFFDDMLTFV